MRERLVLDCEEDAGEMPAEPVDDPDRHLGLEQALPEHRPGGEVDDQAAVAADRGALDAGVPRELGNARRPTRGHDHDDNARVAHRADRRPGALRDRAVAAEQRSV